MCLVIMCLVISVHWSSSLSLESIPSSLNPHYLSSISQARLQLVKILIIDSHPSISNSDVICNFNY